MFESIIMLLIYVCLLAAVVYLVIWVLGQLGVALPAMVIKILWIIVALVVILLLFRMIGPALSSGHLPGLR